MTEEQNVVAVPIKKAIKRGASLIIIDQRETELTRYSKIWLRPNPGSESILVGGMIRVILDESIDDHEFLAEHCEGLVELKNSLWDFDLLKVELSTGIPRDQIQSAARLFASNKTGSILYGLETVAPDLRDNCVRGLVDLALVTGNLGKPSTGLYPLFPGANDQGSRDVGCSPTYLPGYSLVSDDQERNKFLEIWGAEEIPSTPGFSLTEVTEAIRRGQIRALHIIGDSPNFTNGVLGDFLETVTSLEFLVVQDTFIGELTCTADVVLPSATFAQKEGTNTNLERRVQLYTHALDITGEERPDWEILTLIAKRMGDEGFEYSRPEDVFKEINKSVETYSGISYQRLQSGGLQWPCTALDMPDTSVLYANTLGSRKPMLSPLKFIEIQKHNDSQYPFLMAMGRVLHQPDRDTEIVKVGGRNTVVRKDVLEIHQDDARDLGVADGDWVEAISERGRVGGVARLCGTQRKLISTTMLFGQLITEIEASDDHDPVLRIPDLPLLPVRIDKITDLPVVNK